MDGFNNLYISKKIIKTSIILEFRRPNRYTILQQSCLQTHRHVLQSELEIYPVIDILLEEGVIDVSDHDEIEDQKLRKKQRQCLVSILGKASWEKFGCIIWAFEQAELNCLLNDLQKDTNPSQTQGNVYLHVRK